MGLLKDSCLLISPDCDECPQGGSRVPPLRISYEFLKPHLDMKWFTEMFAREIRAKAWEASVWAQPG